MKKIAILFSGKGTNMENLIKKSQKENLDVKFISITDNPKALGIKKARKLAIPLFTFFAGVKNAYIDETGIKELKKIIMDNYIDYIFLAGFMRILPNEFVREFKWRIINIHPSLLPSFKGLNAQKQAFNYGVKVSGCTVHFVDEGIDTGPIIIQSPVDISNCIDEDCVNKKILKQEHKTYFHALKLLLSNNLKIDKRRVDILENAERKI